MDANSQLVEQLFDRALLLGTVFLIAGVAVALVEFVARLRSESWKTPANPTDPTEHSFTGVMDGAAKLAAALKGLDATARLMVVGVALLGVAALASGLDSIGAAGADGS